MNQVQIWFTKTLEWYHIGQKKCNSSLVCMCSVHYYLASAHVSKALYQKYVCHCNKTWPHHLVLHSPGGNTSHSTLSEDTEWLVNSLGCPAVWQAGWGTGKLDSAWWRHYVETLSVLLALCEGNPQVTGRSTPETSRNAEIWRFLCC